MKKLLTILGIILFASCIFAQTPNFISYQAVIRNSNGALITNTTVGMRIYILHNSSSGTAVYQELQNPTTNANGLVSLKIGNGAVVSGSISGIDWSNGTYYVKTETDPTGSVSYSITGTEQLLSVPYALYSAHSKSIAGSGIAVSGDTIKNTSPDKTISITGTGVASVSGTYPNFTVNADISSALPKFISNVNLVNLYNASVPQTSNFTTLDVSSYVPAGSKYAILYVYANGSGLYLDFRCDPNSSSMYSGTGGNTALLNLGTINEMQLIVPISVSGIFQYLFSSQSGTGTGSLIITLVGYY